ncbi:MAG: hypothetical protein WBE08_11015 [Methyloceanibacter sp.]
MMKAIIFAVASVCVVTASATPSVARPNYQDLSGSTVSAGHGSSAAKSAYPGRGAYKGRYRAGSSRSASHHRQTASRTHATPSSHRNVGARPARWCGWWMRTQKGGGPELNLAANWRHWGRPSGPRVGAVVVWSHHVGIITGRTAGGEWIVKSGNDGGAVRERPRSVSGAVFRV